MLYCTISYIGYSYICLILKIQIIIRSLFKSQILYKKTRKKSNHHNRNFLVRLVILFPLPFLTSQPPSLLSAFLAPHPSLSPSRSLPPVHLSPCMDTHALAHRYPRLSKILTYLVHIYPWPATIHDLYLIRGYLEVSSVPDPQLFPIRDFLGYRSFCKEGGGRGCWAGKNKTQLRRLGFML